MNILIVGDVFSKLGRASFEENIRKIKEERKINFIIVNGENTSHGKGLNENHYKWYLSQGVNVITLGNHSYNNPRIFDFIDNVNNIVRPANFKEGARGKGYCTINYNGIKITVIQVIGQVFMGDGNDDPFQKTKEILNSVESDIYICDFHGEATSEKIAFGYVFDGKIQIIFGTHTHVSTNDARILDNGSAYITDVGMTGALDGVIGVEKNIIMDRYLNNGQTKFSPQDSGKRQFNAIIVEINDLTLRPTKIETIKIID